MQNWGFETVGKLLIYLSTLIHSQKPLNLGNLIQLGNLGIEVSFLFVSLLSYNHEISSSLFLVKSQGVT